MVDGAGIEARLDRLAELTERLDDVRSGGEEAYLADETLRAATQRRLQLAIQACIDVGAQLATELSVEPPTDYSSVFVNLARAGFLERTLADRLADAAKQRNLLVHLYLEVDDRKVFASLSHLDDLRDFATVAQRLVDET